VEIQTPGFMYDDFTGLCTAPWDNAWSLNHQSSDQCTMLTYPCPHPCPQVCTWPTILKLLGGFTTYISTEKGFTPCMFSFFYLHSYPRSCSYRLTRVSECSYGILLLSSLWPVSTIAYQHEAVKPHWEDSRPSPQVCKVRKNSNFLKKILETLC